MYCVCLGAGAAVLGREEHLEHRGAVAVVLLLPALETAVPCWADGAFGRRVETEVGMGGALVLPGLATAVLRSRSQQFHALFGYSHEPGGGGAVGIHDMHGRQ